MGGIMGGAARIHQSITTEGTAQETLTNTETIIAALGGDGNSHLSLFTGDIYYTDAAQPDNTGDGKSPETAKQTIVATTALMSAGDRFVTKAGIYTENVVMALASMEWEPEIGTVIVPASGVALTVSGAYCKIWMPGGSLFITAAAGETGVLWSGNRGYPSDIRVACGSSALIGYDLTGSGIDGNNLRCASPLTAAFKIQGDTTRLEDCCTGGEVVDTSIGFWVTNSCDKPRLKDCGSQGHASGGYVVDAGVTNGVAKDCESGGGDGRRIDVDNAFVWSNYTFDDKVFKEITFAGVPTAYNLFKVTGGVRLSMLTAHVETQIANVASNLHVELYSVNGSTDITDAPGPNIQALVAGSVLVRNEDSTGAIDVGEPDGVPAVVENTNFRDPETPIDIIKDNSADTYVRIVITAALASGVMHWHAKWEPLTDDGFLEAA